MDDFIRMVSDEFIEPITVPISEIYDFSFNIKDQCLIIAFKNLEMYSLKGEEATKVLFQIAIWNRYYGRFGNQTDHSTT